MTSCAFCGRENDVASRFCIDCGKPMNPSAVRVGPAYVPHPSGVQPIVFADRIARSAATASPRQARPVTEATSRTTRAAQREALVARLASHCFASQAAASGPKRVQARFA